MGLRERSRARKLPALPKDVPRAQPSTTRVPHVLTAGPVPLEGARIISWDAVPEASD